MPPRNPLLLTREGRRVKSCGERFPGISIYRFEGGRVAEQWHETNALGLLQQFGALPEPPGTDNK
mgnify:CR=1 FL=1